MPMFGGVKGNSVLPRVDETTDKLSTAPETSSKSRNRFGWGGANRGGSATAKDNRRGSYGKQRRPSAAAVAAAAALMGELEEVDDPADLEAVVGNSSAVSVLDSSNHSYQSATSTSTYSKYLQYPQPPGVKSILKTTTSSSSHTNSASSGEESSSSIQLSALAEEVPPKQQPNTVSFDRIVVAEYAIMLGNAPYAEGAPIAMGPEKVGEATYHLEDYEDLRAMPSHKKKSTGLRLGPEQRSQMYVSY